jgi:hypothetical protein
VIEHLKLLAPWNILDPRATAVWWGMVFGTALYTPVLIAFAFGY